MKPLLKIFDKDHIRKDGNFYLIFPPMLALVRKAQKGKARRLFAARFPLFFAAIFPKSACVFSEKIRLIFGIFHVKKALNTPPYPKARR